MQVKLLLPVVEEMTSLSNIFRRRQYEPIEKEGVRTIEVRTFPTVEEVEEEGREIDPYAVKEQQLSEKENTIVRREREVNERIAQIENERRRALEEVENSRQSWLTEKEQLQKEAYAEGFQKGQNEGFAEAQKAMQEQIERANEIARLSKQNGDAHIAAQERVILDLAMATARRIIGAELKGDEETYLAIVKRAIKEARETEEIKLYISPKYFDLVSQNRDELETLFPPDIPFLIFANEDFEATECYVETNHGRIEVTIDTQLKELKNTLVSILESGDES